MNSHEKKLFEELKKCTLETVNQFIIAYCAELVISGKYSLTTLPKKIISGEAYTSLLNKTFHWTKECYRNKLEIKEMRSMVFWELHTAVICSGHQILGDLISICSTCTPAAAAAAAGPPLTAALAQANGHQLDKLTTIMENMSI